MDDEVRRLLTDFADRTVGEDTDGRAGMPDGFEVDVDADVARGRRALRRIRRRRRAAGVLAVASVVAAVAVTGGPGAWFAGDGSDLATEGATDAASTSASIPASASARASETGPGEGRETMSAYGAARTVVLAKGANQWGDIGCGLAPLGWQAQPNRTGYAVLAPPSSRSSDGSDLNGKLVLRTSAEADKIVSVVAVRQPGRIVHLGWYAAGERVAQTKLGDTWLIVRTPLGAAGWDDTVLLRFVQSCSVTSVELRPTPTG